MAKTRIGAPAVHFNGPGETSWINDLPLQANPNYVVYFNDFLVAENYDTTNAFNQVKDTGAAVAIVADGFRGAITITSTATTDNDGGYFGLAQENFLLASTKKLWMSALVKASSVADQDLFVGLSEAVATNPENVIADATHRIGFEILDGSAVIYAKTSNGTTASAESTTISAVNDTYIKLDLFWDGEGTVKFYVDDVLQVSKTTHLPAATDTLTPGFYSLSGSATGTRTATMDYMLVVAER